MSTQPDPKGPDFVQRPTSPGHVKSLAVLMRLAVLLTVVGLSNSMALAQGRASWALTFSGQSNEQFFNSNAWHLIAADLHIAENSDRMLAFVGPPGPVFTSQKRYVWSTSCQAHNCDYKGFFWIDARTGKSLSATSELPTLGAADPEDRVLTLGSVTLTSSSIPSSAMDALRKWITRNDLRFTAAQFIGRDGSVTQLDETLYQPTPAFVPPPGGPGFDCSKAKNAIETDVCHDSTLAALDLRLQTLYGQIEGGLATVGQIAHLKDLQHSWLRRRDQKCAVAVQRRRCLEEAYSEQYQQLENWVPR